MAGEESKRKTYDARVDVRCYKEQKEGWKWAAGEDGHGTLSAWFMWLASQREKKLRREQKE